MKRNKKRTGIVAAAVAALLLLTGTYAWTAFSQQALNEKSGKNEAGGRVHDDYNKASGNKDIYAENYSSQNLIARVKLSEYIENNGTSLVDGATKDNKDSWTPYNIGKDNVFRHYVTWDLGGQKVYLPTFNKDNESLISDASGDAIDETKNEATARGTGAQDDFVLGQKYAFDPEDDDKETKQDPASPDDPSKTIDVVKNEAKNTLTQDQAPITMTEWKALPKDKQTGNYWVVDKDGWAYWANILAPGETTSLLLDQLNWNSESVGGLDKWYYGIDVVGEFVSPIDKDKFPNSEHGAPSTDANYLIANLTEVDLDQVTLDFTSDVSSVSMKSDATEQFGAQVNQMTLSGPSDLKADDIEWTISPSTAGTVDKTGKVTLNSLDADTDITVTAKSASYNLSNSFTIKGLKAEDKYALDFTSDVSNVSIKSGESQQFGAKVNKVTTSGSSDVSATDITWSISPSTAGTVDETGKVTLNSLDADTDITVTAKSDAYNVSNSFTLKGLKAESEDEGE